MAEMPKINITIDEDALREQVTTVITDAARTMAMNLRAAADALDGGAMWRDLEEHQAHLRRVEYDRGRRDEREAQERKGSES